MLSQFSLTLMVNHACNLRCTYCYTGAKFQRSMGSAIARRAIERALASTAPTGVLDLGFFGGEPLLEAEAIHQWVNFAHETAVARNIEVRAGLTTNGTIDSVAAWQIYRLPNLNLSISHDGLPEAHDRHRGGTSRVVMRTIQELAREEIPINVVMVIRPDTLETFPAGLRYLHEQGVGQVTPSLDLWTSWTRADAACLQRGIQEAADYWANNWPSFHVSWFDEKAAGLLNAPTAPTARCQFGHGQIAVSPAGNLYPCERLIGDDADDNLQRLPGHACDDGPLGLDQPYILQAPAECQPCGLQSLCGTYCRCSNFIRTGNVNRPDGLLCWLETLCTRETSRAISPWRAKFPEVFTGPNTVGVPL